jgi:uncharacterized protein YneF (UPF0154 family)
MKYACVKSSLMMMLFVLFCVGLGFVGGYYYEKQQQSHKQIKENFRISSSTLGIIGFIVGCVILVILIILYNEVIKSRHT